LKAPCSSVSLFTYGKRLRNSNQKSAIILCGRIPFAPLPSSQGERNCSLLQRWTFNPTAALPEKLFAQQFAESFEKGRGEMADRSGDAEMKEETADSWREEEQRSLPLLEENGTSGSCDQIGQLVSEALAVAKEQLTSGDHGAEPLVDEGPIGTLHLQADGVTLPTGESEEQEQVELEGSGMNNEQKTIVQRSIAKVEKVVETTLLASTKVETADGQWQPALGHSLEKEEDQSPPPPPPVPTSESEEEVVVVNGRDTRLNASTQEKAATEATNDVSTRTWPDGSDDEINAANAEQKIANVAEVETAAGGVETSVYSDKLASMTLTEGEEQKVDSAPNDEPIPMIDDGSPEAGAALTAAESLDGGGKEATDKNGQQLKDNNGSDSASRGARFRQRMKHACSLI
ncbi:hypothetical protein M513_05911, partial [Trichuris suis]